MENISPAAYEALLNGPALPPPPGVIPNFDHPDTLSVYAVPTVTLAIIFSTLALAMRIYTQRCIQRPLYWEDYTAVLAWAMFISWCAPNLIAARYGGANQWNTRLKDLFTMLYWSNVVQILYGPVIFMVKLSLLLQYLRIFVPNRRTNMSMYIGIVIVFSAHLMFYIVVTFFQIFSCNPREMAWNKLITKGHCFDLPATFVASGAVNVVSDFGVLVMPVFAIWKLHISIRQKIQVSAAFAAGLLVCCASIGRLVYIIILFETKNQTRAIIAPGLCGIAEVSLGLICTCLPTMPMFFTVVRSQLPQLSILGFKPFKNATVIPQLDSESPAFRATPFSHGSIWQDSAGDKGSTATVYELEGWQMTPRTSQLLVHISSPGRRKGQDPVLEEGKILQTVSVQVESKDISERSYYDDS